MADARRTLESSAHHTRGGGAPAPDHDAAHADRTRRVEAEQQRLIQWAKENRKLGGRLPPEFTRGGEHQVYFHRAKQRYLKATLPERQLGYGIALGSNSRAVFFVMKSSAKTPKRRFRTHSCAHSARSTRTNIARNSRRGSRASS